jgi:hypothetical protein
MLPPSCRVLRPPSRRVRGILLSWRNLASPCRRHQAMLPPIRQALTGRPFFRCWVIRSPVSSPRSGVERTQRLADALGQPGRTLNPIDKDMVGRRPACACYCSWPGWAARRQLHCPSAHHAPSAWWGLRLRWRLSACCRGTRAGSDRSSSGCASPAQRGQAICGPAILSGQPLGQSPVTMRLIQTVLMLEAILQKAMCASGPRALEQIPGCPGHGPDATTPFCKLTGTQT